MFKDKFTFDLQRFVDIKNLVSYTVVSGTDGNDSIDNGGSNVTIDAGAGNDSIWNGGSNVTIDAGDGNDYVENVGPSTSISGGAGNDRIRMPQFNYVFYVTMFGGDGNDDIDNYASNVSISGGAGKDDIYNYASNVTINGGVNADYIENTGSNVLFQYSAGDSKDVIYGFNETSTLQIGGGSGSYSSTKSGNDVVVDVGKGNITLVGAASLSAVNIDGNSWTLDGSTATYGSLVVKGVKSLDGISLDGKIVTVSKASLGTEKISVSDGYTLALGDNVSIPYTKENWSLSKTTAKYKRTTTAGYTLKDNSITYSDKSTEVLVTVKGVTSLDGLSLSGTTVTVTKSSLGTKDVTISAGYTLALGSNVETSSSKKSWSLSNSTATYKQTTSAGYSLDDNSIVYSAASSETLAKVKGATTKSGLKVSGNTIKLPASALSKKVTVSGDYTFDFASDYSKATITGSSSDDTIVARGKNILVKGGKGSDVFALKSTGTIHDYEEEDKVSLSSAAEISVSGDDVIFNVKVTLTGAADKAVIYIEDGAEKVFKYTPAAVKFNAKGTSVTLLADYAEDSFDTADFSEYKNTVVTIKASAVQQPLEIFGNKKANKIFGTNEDDFIDGKTGSDTLWGGAGKDTLFGGAGKDIFVYHDGNGSDVIEDFDASLDKIRVLSGDVSTPTVDSAGDVTFAVGDGEIVVKGGANKYIPIYDSGKNILMKYNPR